MELQHKRKRGRPQGRFMDVVKEHMAEGFKRWGEMEADDSGDHERKLLRKEEKEEETKNQYGH